MSDRLSPEQIHAAYLAAQHKYWVVALGQHWCQNVIESGRRGYFRLGGRFRDLADLQGAFAGHGATMIAAGPSLRRNIGAVSPDTVNICVAAAYRLCMERGVKIDYVFTADPQPREAEFLAGIEPDPGTGLIAPVSIHPDVIEAWPGPVYWWRQRPAEIAREARERVIAETGIPAPDILGPAHELADLVESQAGVRGYLLPMGIVGTTMIGLAMAMLGCRVGFLIGHDLAWQPGDYSVSGLEWHSGPNEADPVVDWLDINGEPCVTSRVFLAAAQATLALINQFGRIGRPVYNCSAGGIVNCNVADLSEAYAHFGVPVGPVEAIA